MRSYYLKHRTEFIILRDYIIGWEIAMTLWMLVRNVGVTVQAPVQPTVLENLEMLLIFGPLAGILFGLAQIKLETYWYGKVPLWVLAVRGIVSSTVIMTVLFMLAYVFFREVVVFDEEVTFVQFITNPNAIMTYAYSIFVASVMSTIRQLNLLLGKGKLWRLLRGDFYNPRVENRVFMFIDLKGSTKIAEQLGHLKYSQFLQDCFKDLSVVGRFDAEIYQYVGDEVVLSWRVRPNMDYSRCLDAYWAFEDQLISRTDYYGDKYGIQPEFKAGLHLGEVTTAEVGDLKREIAHHGDTINVTSRIQEKCNEFDSSLLISEDFMNRIYVNGKFKADFKAEEKLRGREESIKLFSLERTKHQ